MKRWTIDRMKRRRPPPARRRRSSPSSTMVRPTPSTPTTGRATARGRRGWLAAHPDVLPAARRDRPEGLDDGSNASSLAAAAAILAAPFRGLRAGNPSNPARAPSPRSSARPTRSSLPRQSATDRRESPSTARRARSMCCARTLRGPLRGRRRPDGGALRRARPPRHRGGRGGHRPRRHGRPVRDAQRRRLTEIVWQLGAPIDPPLVGQAQRLAFLARKLEYALAVGDKVLYAETVAESASSGADSGRHSPRASRRRISPDRRRDRAAWHRRARGCRSGEAARGGGAIAADDT